VRRTAALKPTLLLLTATLPLALGVGPCPVNFAPAAPVRITLDPTNVHQRIDGIGANAVFENNLIRLPEPSRTQVLDLSFAELEPSVVRIKVRPSIEPVNDDADPAHVNAAAFIPPADQLWQSEQIFARGNPMLIAALWSPPAWMKDNNKDCCGGSLIHGLEPELAELFSVWLGYHRDLGHPVDHVSIQNEPEVVQPWDTNYYYPPDIGPATEALAQRLVADGHATRILGADSGADYLAQFFLSPVLAQPTAPSLLSALAFHLYGSVLYFGPYRIRESMQALRQVTPAQLPLWMTEYSNTSGSGYGTYDEAMAQAEIMHESFVNGASLYAIWTFYYPGGPGEALISITTNGSGNYTVHPKYWTARQYMKYVRAGAFRIDAASDDSAVLASAYHNPDGSIVSVLINKSTEPRWAVVEGGSFNTTPRFVRTAPGENGIELPVDSVERFGKRMLRLPARSVATAVWPAS
jgi:O-glycosyl hydrolase